MRQADWICAAFLAVAGTCAAATYTWTGGAGDGLFSTPGNWQDGDAPVAATAADNLVFTAGGTATNDIANLTVGDIAVTLAAGEELTLGGGKFNGSGTFSLNGAGRLVFDATGGLDAQPIVINGGIFKVGDSLTGSALGSASDDVPIRVNAGGTLDVNYGLSGIDYARSQVTHDKLIYIAGTGAAGYGATGAIINSASKNGGNTYTLGDIVLTADATIGGSNRVDVVTLVDDDGVEYGARATHSSVTGPYVLTFADANPSRAIYKGLWKGSVNVKSITVTSGAELLFGTGVTFTLTDSVLNLVDGGKICAWDQDYRFPYPINVTGGSNRIRCGSGQGYIDGALTVPSGAGLAVSDGTVNFYGPVEISGAVTNTGAQLHFYTEVQGNTVAAAAGNTTYFHGGLYGVVTLLGKSNAAGQAVFYEDTSCFHGYFRSSGEGTVDGRTGKYVRKSGTIFTGMTSSSVTGGITVDNQPNFGAFGDAIGDHVLITNSDIRVTGAFSAGHPGPRASVQTTLRLGEGTTVTAHTVQTGGQEADTTIRSFGRIELLPGSVVNVTNMVCIGYHRGTDKNGKVANVTTVPRGGTTNEWLLVDGGTLNAEGVGINVGYSGPTSRFYLRRGTVNAEGVYLKAYRPKDAGITRGLNNVGGHDTYRFIMTGGTFNMGAWGIVTLGCGDNSEADAILAGGTMNATKDFPLPYYIPTLFGYGNWRREAGEGFTLNTAGHTVTLTTALNGMGDVRLTGNGTVAGTNAIQGVLGGTWTVDSGMTADLRGASSLLGGFSVGANAAVTLDVGAGRSAAFFTRDGSWPLTDSHKNILTYFNEADGGTVSPLISHDMGLWNVSGGRADLPTYAGGSREAIVSKGEFYVAPEEAGTWTFSGNWADNIHIQIDDESATATSASNYANLQVALTEGWHRFVIVTAHNTGNACGPSSRKGMAVGFAKRAVSDNAAKNYTLFSPKNLKMRPSAPCGGEASVRWSSAKGTVWADTSYVTTSAANYCDNWDWDAVSLTNSLKLLNRNGTGDPRLNGGYTVNRWDGWFLVPFEKAGTWRIRLNYGDRCRFFLDGSDSGAESASTDKASTGDVSVTAGWHRYEIRTWDKGGAAGPWPGVEFPAVSYAVKTAADADFGAFVPFDEDSLTLSLAPDGYLQGEIALASGAAVTNVSETAAVVWGDVKVADGAAGAVMSGKFACVSNTVDFGTVAANTSDLTEVLRFDDAATNLFADVGKIAVDFAARPTRGTVVVGPAGGLETLGTAGLKARLAVTVNGVDAETAGSNAVPIIKNGNLCLCFSLGTVLGIR